MIDLFPYRPRAKPRFLQGFGSLGAATTNVKRWHDKKGLPHPSLRLPFWENSGSLAYDLSGNRYNCTLEENSVWATTINGPTVELDGTDDYMTCSAAPPLSTFTIEMVAKRKTVADTYGVIFGHKNNYGALVVYDTGDLVYIDSGGSPRHTWADIWTDKDSFHHLCFTQSEAGTGNINAYFDGVSLGSSSESTYTISGFKIGRYIAAFANRYFGGWISKTSIYPIVLSSDQINFLKDNPHFDLYPISVPSYFFVGEAVGTTAAPTTEAPTTLAPTTLAPTTLAPTTLAPTTLPPTTLAPTTPAPTTAAPTTSPPTTLAPTTLAPTTVAPTTLAPTTADPCIIQFVGYDYDAVDSAAVFIQRIKSVNIGTRTNGLLVVSADIRDATPTTGSIEVESVLWNGVNLSKATSGFYVPNEDFYTSIWYLVNPDDGTHNLVVNYSGNGTTTGARTVYTNIAWFDGALQKQGAVLDQTNQGQGSAAKPTLNINPTEDYEMILATITNEYNGGPSSYDQIKIHDYNPVNFYSYTVSYTAQTTAALEAMAVTWPGAGPYVMSAASFRSACSSATTPPPTTPPPTTSAPTTAAPTTLAPTTEAPTTAPPTTVYPSTYPPSTAAPTTSAPTTQAPTTAAPTTEAPTTLAPTTEAPTTVPPTTSVPTTPTYTTFYPSTPPVATTPVPTTSEPPTTAAPSTPPPSTAPPTTAPPTTAWQTSAPPTTKVPTSKAPTTSAPTTQPPTTLAATTAAPTTLAPTTLAPTTLAPTTIAPTTVVPTTVAPTTLPPTTAAPTTVVGTTAVPTTTLTTAAPTTVVPTTVPPTTPFICVERLDSRIRTVITLDSEICRD